MKLDPRWCQEIVHGPRVHMWQCQRKPGHGPGKRFCKQHGQKHSKKEAAVPLWKLENGSYSRLDYPAKVLVREVGLSTFIDSEGKRTSLICSWANYYRTEKEALQEAVNRASSVLRRAEKDVTEATSALALLRRQLLKWP